MKKTLILLATLVALGTASAQYNETNNLFYHAQRAPQSNMLNPAFFPSKNTFYLQLPASSFQLGLPLSVNEIVKYDPAQQANIISIDTILDKLATGDPFRLGMDFNLLGFGFKVKHLFFDFNTQIRTSFSFGLSENIANALRSGNTDSHGNAIPSVTLLNGDLFNMQAYLETSVGAGYRFSSIPLTVGVHAKLLSGIINVQTDNTDISIETDPNFNKVTVRMYYEMMEAAAVPIDTAGGLSSILSNMGKHVGESAKSMFLPFGGNNGLAFDLGAKYELGPFKFSASINDLSAGIHWQKNVNRLVPKGGQGVIEFEGVDLSGMLNGGQLNTDSLRYITEQLKEMMPTFITDSGDYWYNIPTKINLAASYDFAKLLRVGLLFHGQFDRGLLSKQNVTRLDLPSNGDNPFRFNTTLTLGLNLFNWAEFIVGSSLVFDGKTPSFFNPGAGIIFTPATVLQSYIMVDYMSSIYLADIKSLNLKFGMNILIGKH